MTKKRPGERNGSTRKLSISITTELDEALEAMCVRTGVNKSRVIENTLRSNRTIAVYIEALNAEKALQKHYGAFAAIPGVETSVSTPVYHPRKPEGLGETKESQHSRNPEGEMVSESSEVSTSASQSDQAGPQE